MTSKSHSYHGETGKGWLGNRQRFQIIPAALFKRLVAASLPGIYVLHWIIPDVPDGKPPGEGRGPCSSYSPPCSQLTLYQVPGTGQGLSGVG